MQSNHKRPGNIVLKDETVFGLRRALFKRMGWRAHLSSLQIGGGVAERRPHVHAWLSETAKQMMTPRLTRTHQAEIAQTG